MPRAAPPSFALLQAVKAESFNKRWVAAGGLIRSRREGEMHAAVRRTGRKVSSWFREFITRGGRKGGDKVLRVMLKGAHTARSCLWRL